MKRYLTLFIVALLLAVAVPHIVLAMSDGDKIYARCQKQNTEAKGKDNIDAKCTAAQLYYSFKNNEVAADNKYKNKWIRVSGYVYAVKKNIAGTPYLVLGVDNYGIAQVDAYLFSVQVDHFEGGNAYTASAIDEAAGIKRGKHVTVTGKCTGTIMGMPQVEECLITPPNYDK